MAKEGTWEEEDKSDGTFLLVIEAGGVDQRAAWVLGTFTFVCKKMTPQTASLPLSHCGPGTDMGLSPAFADGNASAQPRNSPHCQYLRVGVCETLKMLFIKLQLVSHILTS